MIHSMKLRKEPFESIKKGRKTIELRLYDEKRQSICVEDIICFTLIDGGEEIYAKVIKLHVFPSFKELYESLPLDKCGYDDVGDAKYKDMEDYYSITEQEQYGVVGIEIILLKDFEIGVR